jgi:hypothetical protein
MGKLRFRVLIRVHFIKLLLDYPEI